MTNTPQRWANAPAPAQNSSNKDLSREEVDAAFQRLRQLQDDCGPTTNKNDQATVLIHACIDEGFNEGCRIVGSLVHLGFTARHVGITLTRGTGSDPALHRWYRDKAGFYHNHPN